MTNGKQDQEFERYLAGDSPVSRRYAELDADNPSPELDARILTEAKRARNVWYLPLTGPARRWTTPVALAATVLLSFTLVMNIVIETPMSISDETSVSELRRESRALPGDELSSIDEIVPTTRAIREATVAGNADGEVKMMAHMLGRVGEAGITEAEKDASELATLAQLPSAMTSGRDADEKLYALAARAPKEVFEPDRPERIILEPTIEVIRAHVEAASNRPADEIVPLATLRKNDLAIKESAGTELAMAPEARLDRILKLYDENRHAEANLAITEFRRLYPDHPVSAELVRRGL